jgi:hypothetical protein
MAKKGMHTFMGCQIGEKRAGLLPGTEEYDNFLGLVKKGLLEVVEEEHNRKWFALTKKGKDHVRKLEEKYMRL